MEIRLDRDGCINHRIGKGHDWHFVFLRENLDHDEENLYENFWTNMDLLHTSIPFMVHTRSDYMIIECSLENFGTVMVFLGTLLKK